MVLQKSLIKECLKITIVMLIILLSISMMSQFGVYLRAVVSGSLDINLLLPLLISFLPQYLSLVLPLSFFIAIIVVLNKCQTNNTLVIITTSGMGRYDLFSLFLPLAIAMFIIALILNLFVIPYSSKQAQKIINIQESLDSLDMITPNTFTKLSNSTTLYTKSTNKDKTILYDIYLLTRPKQDTTPASVIYAKMAKVANKGDNKIIEISDGYQTSVVPGKANITKIQFDAMNIKMPGKAHAITLARKESMGNLELLESDDPKVYQYFYWRVSLALLIPVLFIISFFMLVVQSRVNNSAKNFLVQFSVCLVYLGLLITTSSLAGKGSISPMLAYPAVHIGVILIAFLFYKVKSSN